MRRRALAAAVCLAAAGCGSDKQPALLDPEGEQPLVNALEVDPRDGTLMVTTNRGFFRVKPGSGDAREVRGLVRVGRRTSPVGQFLEILVDGDGTLYGSGHPDQPETLPQFLGLLSSSDGGQTWGVVSRLGRADLHEMVAAHDRIYAADAVVGALLVTRDGGRTFTERFLPRGAVVDLAVSPDDPEVVVVSLGTHLFRSEDQGRTWDLTGEAAVAHLAWPSQRTLYGAQSDGVVLVSDDAGRKWRRAGKLPGEPVKLREVSERGLFAVLADGSIHESADGARTWKAVYGS